MNKDPQKIEISHRTIIFATLFILGLWLLWQIRDILLLLFVSVTFMSALNPLVSRLERFRFPRWLSILFIYILLILGLSFLVSGIIPPLVSQSKNLVNDLPTHLSKLNTLGITPQIISSQFKVLENLPGEILRLAVSFFSNILVITIIFVITFYLLLEHKNAARYSFFLFGEKSNQKALQVLELLENRLGSWVGAQFLLMFIVGLLSYFGYLALGLEYALPLALAAGLLEVIPNIGPTITALLATLAGLTVSPLIALAALAWGLVVQQLENNLIVPKIMKEAVGINPLVTILSLAIGFKLAGIPGALLAIPFYLTLEVILTALFTETIPSPKKSKKALGKV